jgi:chromosomal replication initiator protein
MGCGTATPTFSRSQHNQLSQMNMMNTTPIHLDPTAVIPMPLPKGWRRRWADIVRQVCKEHRVKPEELLTGCRMEHLVEARADLYWFARRDTPLSLPEIGRRAGGRDHTTVLTGLRRAIARRGAPR